MRLLFCGTLGVGLATAYTGSISKGRPAHEHNNRGWYERTGHWPDNVDPSLSAQNVVLVDRDLGEVYAETFGQALQEYNARQADRGHPERRIDDYLLHVKSSKTLKEMYEFVVQVGNHEEHPDVGTCKRVLSDWLRDFQDDPNLAAHFVVAQAIVHVDEPDGTPHMHVEVVPVAESKRGLELQNSLNKAIKQAGFDSYLGMLQRWDAALTFEMAQAGLERRLGDRETQFGGVSMRELKRTSAARAETERQERARDQARRQADQAGAQLGAVRADLAAARADLRQAQERERVAKASAEDAERRAQVAEGRARDAKAQVEALEHERAHAEHELQQVREQVQGQRGILERLQARALRLRAALGQMRAYVRLRRAHPEEWKRLRLQEKLQQATRAQQESERREGVTVAATVSRSQGRDRLRGR